MHIIVISCFSYQFGWYSYLSRLSHDKCHHHLFFDRDNHYSRWNSVQKTNFPFPFFSIWCHHHAKATPPPFFFHQKNPSSSIKNTWKCHNNQFMVKWLNFFSSPSLFLINLVTIVTISLNIFQVLLFLPLVSSRRSLYSQFHFLDRLNILSPLLLN